MVGPKQYLGSALFDSEDLVKTADIQLTSSGAPVLALDHTVVYKVGGQVWYRQGVELLRWDGVTWNQTARWPADYLSSTGYRDP